MTSKLLVPSPNWSGRFGNNITQMIYMLALAKKNKNYVYIPKHKNIYDSPKIINYVDDEIISLPMDMEKTVIYGPFSLGHKLFFRQNITYSDKQNIVNDIINLLTKKNNDPFNTVFNTVENNIFIDKDALYIHIRSTDIYKSNQKCTVVYAQPPLSFYTKIIEDHNFKQIYILSDDTNNFMVKAIKNLYVSNCIIIHEPNLLKAYEILRSSSHICMSTSSFCTTACFLSSPNNIKHIYGYHYLTNIFHHWFLSDLFGTENIVANNISHIKFHIYQINNYEYMSNCEINNNLYTKTNDKEWWKNGNNNFKFNWKFDDNTKHLMLHHSSKDIQKIYG